MQRIVASGVLSRQFAQTWKGNPMKAHRRLAALSFGLLAPLLLARCGAGQGPTASSATRSSVDNSTIDVGSNDPSTNDASNGPSTNGGSDGPTKNTVFSGIVNFSRDIQPIFSARCAETCHSAATHSGGLDLSEGSARANLLNQPTSAGCMAVVPDSIRVVPCDTQASMLWRKLKPDDSRCRNPMPNGTAGLGVIAPDEFALIERWIAQGAGANGLGPCVAAPL